jgi:hypothetical protein
LIPPFLRPRFTLKKSSLLSPTSRTLFLLAPIQTRNFREIDWQISFSTLFPFIYIRESPGSTLTRSGHRPARIRLNSTSRWHTIFVFCSLFQCPLKGARSHPACSVLSFRGRFSYAPGRQVRFHFVGANCVALPWTQRAAMPRPMEPLPRREAPGKAVGDRRRHPAVPPRGVVWGLVEPHGAVFRRPQRSGAREAMGGTAHPDRRRCTRARNSSSTTGSGWTSSSSTHSRDSTNLAGSEVMTGIN